MKTLGIETSCDETSIAVVTDGTIVLSCAIASSREAFTKAGGVIPEHAAREQVRSILPILDQAMEQAGISPADIDLIAVTRGPGLLGSLLVGTVTARTLAALWKKPLVGVHHTLGHLSSPWLSEAPFRSPKSEVRSPQFPLLTLSVSGGHTELWLRHSHTQGTLLGQTRDDAAGEAFDKGASLLGLPYPGGPSIAKAAEGGDSGAFPFPHPLHSEETLDFSYSGLKTSLKYLLRDLGLSQQTDNYQLPTTHSGLRGPQGLRTANYQLVSNLAASFQHALCIHLTSRVTAALEQHPEAREVHVVGGVSANRHLRSLMADVVDDRPLRFPKNILYCTDNAAMIAAAGTFLRAERGEEAKTDFETSASIPSSDVFGAAAESHI